MLDIGDMLEQKYQITSVLGRGGWSSVYLAQHVKLGNKWAVKEIDLKREERINLLAEPEILKRLNHSSLPRIVDIFRHENYLYIVEDYFAGTSLKELINNRELCKEENVIEWAKQLCNILIYLHTLKPNPIIYRDLKPGNIIIDMDNNVKLIDFGIAREYKHGQSGDTTTMGTRGYAPPEQYWHNNQTDERSDIFALGATLYHVLTGVTPNNHPYRTVPLREINKELSTGIEKIITRCMHNESELRYSSVEELLEDLNNIRKLGKGHSLDSFLNTLRSQFKRKPQRKIKDKISGTTVIAVGGANRGVGCTHTSIAIATYLARNKCKVALVELNSNPVFYTLEEEESSKVNVKGIFRLAGVDFYKLNPHSLEANLGPVFNGGYSYVVLDLGLLLKQNEVGEFQKNPWYDEMYRADISILMAGSALWQLKDIAPFIKERETAKWKLVFRAPDPEFFREIKKEMVHSTFATMFTPDSFACYEEQDAIFHGILNT